MQEDPYGGFLHVLDAIGVFLSQYDATIQERAQSIRLSREVPKIIHSSLQKANNLLLKELDASLVVFVDEADLLWSQTDWCLPLSAFLDTWTYIDGTAFKVAICFVFIQREFTDYFIEEPEQESGNDRSEKVSQPIWFHGRELENLMVVPGEEHVREYYIANMQSLEHPFLEAEIDFLMRISGCHPFLADICWSQFLRETKTQLGQINYKAIVDGCYHRSAYYYNELWKFANRRPCEDNLHNIILAILAIAEFDDNTRRKIQKSQYTGTFLESKSNPRIRPLWGMGILRRSRGDEETRLFSPLFASWIIETIIEKDQMFRGEEDDAEFAVELFDLGSVKELVGLCSNISGILSSLLSSISP